MNFVLLEINIYFLFQIDLESDFHFRLKFITSSCWKNKHLEQVGHEFLPSAVMVGNWQPEHCGGESFLPSMGAFLGVRRAQ